MSEPVSLTASGHPRCQRICPDGRQCESQEHSDAMRCYTSVPVPMEERHARCKHCGGLTPCTYWYCYEVLRGLPSGRVVHSDTKITKEQARWLWNAAYESAGPGQSACGPTFRSFDEAWEAVPR